MRHRVNILLILLCALSCTIFAVQCVYTKNSKSRNENTIIQKHQLPNQKSLSVKAIWPEDWPVDWMSFPEGTYMKSTRIGPASSDTCMGTTKDQHGYQEFMFGFMTVVGWTESEHYFKELFLGKKFILDKIVPLKNSKTIFGESESQFALLRFKSEEGKYYVTITYTIDSYTSYEGYELVLEVR